MAGEHVTSAEPTERTDHRKRPRRRGAALNQAIFQAALDELAEHGFANLTMERVADRAKASKASLYRRWPTRVELVMAAVYDVLVEAETTPDTGTLRGDLLMMFRQVAAQLEGPAGEAMRGLLSEALRDSERHAELRDHSQGNARRLTEGVVWRAVQRGEVDPSVLRPRRLEAGFAMLRHYFLFRGVPIPDQVIVEIVDDVVLPLLGVSVVSDEQPLERTGRTSSPG